MDDNEDVVIVDEEDEALIANLETLVSREEQNKPDLNEDCLNYVTREDMKLALRQQILAKY